MPIDVPCPKPIALNPAGTKILLNPAKQKILLAQPCVCKYCEEDWTESLGSPIFVHCNTPRKAFIDFRDIILCAYDPLCDPPLPAPPNGHEFEVIRQDYYWLGNSRCCWWWVQETVDSIVWQVYWGVHWLNGFHPPETFAWLKTDYEGIPVSYFKSYFGVDEYTEPCLPANGGWINNKLVDYGGACADLLPMYGIAAHEGQGRVQW